MIGTTLLIGAALLGGAAIVAFWNDIKKWLNTVAADAVERTLGIKARQNMTKAVAIVDRLVDKIRNTNEVYSKKSPQDTYFSKVTVTQEADINDLEADILEELRKHNNHMSKDMNFNKQTQQFEYTE